MSNAKSASTATAFDPITCERCGNDDQNGMIAEPSAFPGPGNRDRGTRVYLKGWRCAKCGYITPERRMPD